MARKGASGHVEADQFAFEAGGLDLKQGFTADELALVEFRDPAEAGLQGIGGLIDVIAIKAVFHLEAQGVACAEADGFDVELGAGRHHRFPDLHSRFIGHHQLIPEFAGVAGARNHHRDAGSLGLIQPVIVDFVQIQCRELLQGLLGHRPLQGEQGVAVALVGQGNAADEVTVGPFPVLVQIGGIDDHQIVVGEAVDEQIVDDAPLRVAHRRILHLTDVHLADIVDGDLLQKGLGIGSLDNEFAHMGDVEEADGGADPAMLLDDAAVLDGHIIAGELDQLGARLLVHVI
ncbi:MAG: hypothetical protein BWY77_01620 [bacterium ADurb.Bin431]|nr:MAG: hypothetical protein BWY77_01620 [bacterium ADurb.Bin431]